jgi:glutathione S-transferase
MKVVLYDWPASPFCMKVRALLDYKSIDYDRINILSSAWFEVRRRGKIGKVPALEIDGDLVCDSTDIAYKIEELTPNPPIIPADPYQAALCHALEDWADESLYFIGLYFQWQEPEGRDMVPLAFGKGPIGRLAFLGYERAMLRQLRGQGTSRKSIDHLRRDLTRHLDSIEALLADRDFFIEDRPTLCDFAMLGQLHYLRRTPVGGSEIERRPRIVAFLDRMRALRESTR